MHDLHHYLTSLQGEFVLLNGGGPEACQGWLALVQTDYLTLLSDEGAELHLPLHHLRTIQPQSTAAADRRPSSAPTPPTFTELLTSSLGQEVRLNHGGPDVAAGMLRVAAADYVLLEIVPDGLLCFPLFHIRSFYVQAATPASARYPETLQGR